MGIIRVSPNGKVSSYRLFQNVFVILHQRGLSLLNRDLGNHPKRNWKETGAVRKSRHQKEYHFFATSTITFPPEPQVCSPVARILFFKCKSDHVILLLKSLQWSPVTFIFTEFYAHLFYHLLREVYKCECLFLLLIL